MVVVAVGQVAHASAVASSVACDAAPTSRCTSRCDNAGLTAGVAFRRRTWSDSHPAPSFTKLAVASAMPSIAPSAAGGKPSAAMSVGNTVLCASWPRSERKLVAAMPQTVRLSHRVTSSIKWNQPVFEAGGPLAFVRVAKAHVTLGFWRGGELKDPKGLLEGSGTRMAHVKIAEGDALDSKSIAAFLKEAVKLNKAKGDPTKR